MQRALPPVTWTVENLDETPQIQRLWEAVEQDTGNPLLVHFLARLIDVYRVPARDPAALARAVQLYSARRIKFFRERPERFQSALRTVAWGIGDCDDKARFIAASLRTFRIPVQLKFLHLTLPDGRALGHVYPRAFIDGQWTALESVREYPFGYDPEIKLLKKGLNIKSSYIGDDAETTTHL